MNCEEEREMGSGSRSASALESVWGPAYHRHFGRPRQQYEVWPTCHFPSLALCDDALGLTAPALCRPPPPAPGVASRNPPCLASAQETSRLGICTPTGRRAPPHDGVTEKERRTGPAGGAGGRIEETPPGLQYISNFHLTTGELLLFCI
jgi:hypothetical protein